MQGNLENPKRDENYSIDHVDEKNLQNGERDYFA